MYQWLSSEPESFDSTRCSPVCFTVYIAVRTVLELGSMIWWPTW
jgi:hypothetical protein